MFVIYTSALDAKQAEESTAYVDDEVARVGATTQKEAAATLHQHQDELIIRAESLPITYATTKCELMHVIPFTSGRQIKDADTYGIQLYKVLIPPSPRVKILRVHIVHRLSFKAHPAAASANTRRSTGTLYQITQRKGASTASIHHVIKTITLPTLLWGSEVW